MATFRTQKNVEGNKFLRRFLFYLWYEKGHSREDSGLYMSAACAIILPYAILLGNGGDYD